MTAEFEDPYDIPILQSTLCQQGYEFYYTPQTTTTMDMAEEHAKTNGRQPAIFLTDHQTKGQGRGKRRIWVDRPGQSVLMSVGLQINEETTPFFSDMAALHIVSSLRENLGLEGLGVKYPNDLVIDDMKAGGILSRNVYRDTEYLGTNVGIGINMHDASNELEGYSLEYQATSLDLHTSTKPRRQPLVIAILEGLRFVPIDAYIFMTNKIEQEKQHQRWRVLSSILNRKVQIRSGSEIVVTGIVTDTQIGKGIRIGTGWYDRFDETMKVRLAD